MPKKDDKHITLINALRYRIIVEPTIHPLTTHYTQTFPAISEFIVACR